MLRSSCYGSVPVAGLTTCARRPSCGRAPKCSAFANERDDSQRAALGNATTGRGHGEVRANAASQDLVDMVPASGRIVDVDAIYEPVLPPSVPCDPSALEGLQASTTPTAEDVRTKGSKSAFREIVALSIPALGSTLADPVCSLVDTACIGHVSSLQLAALSPCTAIFNFAFLVFQFVGVTLTNKLASNSPFAPGLSTDEALDRLNQNKRLVSYSISFAVVAGIATSALLLTRGEQILTLLGTSPSMMGPAMQYLGWRALAAPAVLLMNVCQGVCLGQQNSLTPLLVFAGVGALNVVLDMWLIIGQGMGCAGAGMGTAAVQWIGALYFIHHLRRKGKRGTSVPITWSGVPTMQDLQPFLGMASVLLSRTVFSLLAFTIVTAAATSRGTVAAASHQVCLQLFWFLSYFPEPLSVAAQSLIARDRADRGKMVMLTRCIGSMSLGLGAAIATACVSCFVFASGAFTSDVAVAAAMSSLAVPAGVALVLCSLAMASDGISIGAGDYRHLPVVNLLGLGATAAYLQWCNAAGLGLLAVWQGLIVVFAVRLAVHSVHHLGLGAGTSVIAEALHWKGSRQSMGPICQETPAYA